MTPIYGTTGVPWTGLPPDLMRLLVPNAPAAKPKVAVKNPKKAFDYRAYQMGGNAPDPTKWFAQGWRK